MYTLLHSFSKPNTSFFSLYPTLSLHDARPILVADSPADIGQHPFSETLLWGCNWGQEDDERVAQLYGPYVLPGSTLDDLHLLCSQWNTAEGWPYHEQPYRVQGLREGMRSRGSS